MRPLVLQAHLCFFLFHFEDVYRIFEYLLLEVTLELYSIFFFFNVQRAPDEISDAHLAFTTSSKNFSDCRACVSSFSEASPHRIKISNHLSYSIPIFTSANFFSRGLIFIKEVQAFHSFA